LTDEAFLIAYDPATAAWYAQYGLMAIGWDTLVKLCEQTMRTAWDTFCPDDGRPARALRALRTWQQSQFLPADRAALDTVLFPLLESWAMAKDAAQNWTVPGPTRAADYVAAITDLVMMQLATGGQVVSCRDDAIRALARVVRALPAKDE
jgi:hypothetical protein